MVKSTKRPLTGEDASSSPSPKRVRQNPQPTLSSDKHIDPQTPSAPSPLTLIDSDCSTEPSPSIQSTVTDETDSLTSSDTSSSEGSETSDAVPPSSPSFFSSDASIVDRALLSMVPRPVLEQDVRRLEALDMETSSDSLTSSSASTSDDESASLESERNESERSTSSPSSAEAPASPSPTARPPTGPLTTKNLNKLQERLDSFLSKLDSANKELERDRAAGKLEERNIENVDDKNSKGYIEMNLGLGVLEEKRDEADANETESSSVSSKARSVSKERPQQDPKEKVIARLLAKPKRKGKGQAKVKIEEVGGE